MLLSIRLEASTDSEASLEMRHWKRVVAGSRSTSLLCFSVQTGKTYALGCVFRPQHATSRDKKLKDLSLPEMDERLRAEIRGLGQFTSAEFTVPWTIEFTIRDLRSSRSADSQT